MVLNRQNLKLVLVPSEAPYAFKRIKNALICPPSPVGVLKLPLDLWNISVFVMLVLLNE